MEYNINNSGHPESWTGKIPWFHKEIIFAKPDPGLVYLEGISPESFSISTGNWFKEVKEFEDYLKIPDSL